MSEGNGKQEVTVVDINMPFMSMVGFMVKWALASIPAFIILLLLVSVLGGVMGGMIGIF